MAKREEQENKIGFIDEKKYSQQLEMQIEELRKAHAETVRLKNVEKFDATGRMARTIAHEIRNPLTNISLALEQLSAETPPNEETTFLLDMMNRNALRINHLITELLNSTKFAQLSFSNASINEILNDVIAQTRSLAAQKNIHVEVGFADHLPEIMVDIEKIKTAFENLINNAIEAVTPNEGKVVITTANENNKCVVTVYNNGTALGEDKIERIFEPYFTSKNSSGLALTHTQNIILNHGGSIYAESETGKGNTFTVILEFA